MSLYIKSQEAHDLAVELARLTGESITKAVTEAIRERLEREQRRRSQEAIVAEAMAIARRCASYPRRDHRSLEEFLYDERGLPRSDS
jgi:antitoxin VapB